MNVYDDAFTCDKARWGTWTSYDLEGKAMITALTEGVCVHSTRCYLKWQQEGFDEPETAYSSEVGGKL